MACTVQSLHAFVSAEHGRTAKDVRCGTLGRTLTRGLALAAPTATTVAPIYTHFSWIATGSTCCGAADSDFAQCASTTCDPARGYAFPCGLG